MKRLLALLTLALLLALLAPPAGALQALDPAPPARPVKLIFIHHSTGENWLRDDYGQLGRALAENNYFVSDTNYGWGPYAIGDRTDIPNWLEWFRGGDTPEIMQAVFDESGQNSSYTRLFGDPGGENTIVMFKSCFPNSELSGDPDDPPTPGTDFTVGNAKYVYNEILQYFATRPDKLFIVITAPPLSGPSEPENARAFNNWLVNDWLRENDYPFQNVAVFDFYNVLTGRDAHHWYNDGRIEDVIGRRDTSAYASSGGDDHPNEAGSRKATEEFIPLLNIYYNRWIASGPGQPASPAGPVVVATGESQPEVAPPSSSPLGLVADFDGLTPSLNAYRDEGAATRIACAPASDWSYEGANALKIEFDVVAGSWSTCALTFDTTQDWSAGAGLHFAIHAERGGIPYNVAVFAGSWEARETYIHYDATPSDGVEGWAFVEIPWSDFARAEWEENGGAPFEKTGQVIEMAFGFDGLENGNNAGTVWVDNIELVGVESAQPPAEEPEGESGGGLPCIGSMLLPAALLGLVWLMRRK